VAYLRLLEASEPVIRIVIHPNKVNHIIVMPPRRLEKLNLAKALGKVGMPQIVKKAVEKTNANKKKKKHDRASVILGLISAIAVKARKTEQITEFAREMKEHIGIKSFPERSSLSRLWRRLDKPLYKVFQELSLIALRLTGKKVSFGNVVALDVQSILSKSKISGVGFVKGRVAKGLKIHLKTVNGVPTKVFFSDASVHDTYYVDEFLKDIRKCDHVVADRAFFRLRIYGEAVEAGCLFHH